MSASWASCEVSEMVDRNPNSSFLLDIDRFDTRPFSESFSGFLGVGDGSTSVLDTMVQRPMAGSHTQEMSYDIERLTNIRVIAPEWGDDVDEIMIMSPKTKSPTAVEITTNSELDSNHKVSSLSNFEILYDLADETKTKITLVRCSISDNLCVLKRMRKGPTHSEDPTSHIWSEQAILETLTVKNIPFMVNMQTSFEDSDFHYLVMDYYPGGDLLSHIAKDGPFQPDRVLSYSSEIAQGIAALHALDIIHHNLRAENVMIDSQGHIVLTGFGRAECISPKVGPEFTRLTYDLEASKPPELILGWKHDFGVDCWSFGILLYMMQVGMHPFNNSKDSRNHDVLRRKIICDPIPFHTLGDVGVDARDLVMKCLERNPALRFSIQQIQAHQYFSTIKWTNIFAQSESKSMRPQTGDYERFSIVTTRSSVSVVSDCAQAPSMQNPCITESATSHYKPEKARLTKTFLPRSAQEQSRTQGNDGLGVVEIGQDTVLDIKAFNYMPNNLWRDSESGEQHPNSLDVSDPENGSLSGSDVHGLPCKLRKQPSSLPRRSQLSTANAVATPSSKAGHKLRKKFRSMQAFTCEPGHCLLDLPKDVEQQGKGIGFTFKVPAANHSTLTVCTTAPDSCYGFFWRGLSSRYRKHAALKSNPTCAKETGPQRPKVQVFSRESSDSFPGGMSPFLLASPFSDTAVNSPTSIVTRLQTPPTLPSL